MQTASSWWESRNLKKERAGLTGTQREEIEALEKLPDDQVDTTDIPEVLDWSDARRGVFYPAPLLGFPPSRE